MNGFNNLIGQQQIKSILSFYVNAQKTGSVIPPIMFNGARGLGKTQFAKVFAKEIGKPLVEINCGSIRNAQQFFEQVFLNHIMNRDAVTLLDECHGLPSDLVNVFLTAFNTDGVKRKNVSFGEDADVSIDFLRQNFLFATTELHMVFNPLRDRMRTVDFKPYTEQELSQIIQNRSDSVQYEDGVLSQITQTVSGNARSAVKIADDIKSYCNVKNIHRMTQDFWDDMKNVLGILPYGLKNVEVQVLQILLDRGPCSLQVLSAITGMSRSAIQKEVENNLLRCGFMEIDFKRKITKKGREIINQLNK